MSEDEYGAAWVMERWAEDNPGRPFPGTEGLHFTSGRYRSVHESLIEVARELGPIAKGDRAPSSMGGFPFRGIETIMAELSPLLAKHGVVIVPKTTIQSVVPSPSMPDGWMDTTITVHWTVYNAWGSWIEAQTCGVGRDKTDKGVTKAQTQAYKYLLLPLFAIADSSTDADGLATEPHVEPPAEVQIIPKIAQDSFLDRIAKLNDEHTEQLAAWFKEHEVVPIRKLPMMLVEDVETILSHFEDLEDVEQREKEGLE